MLSPERSGLSADFSRTQISDAIQSVVEDVHAVMQRKAAEEARESLGTGSGTSDISEAVADAASGRIGKLIVDPAIPPVWGRFDPSDLTVTVNDDPGPADVDLVDRLVVLSVDNGAEVMPVDPEILDTGFVAVRRF